MTPKQEKFCQLYIELSNASEAYRRSYNADGMKEASINVNASKLLSNAKIALRLKELRNDLSDKGLWSREQSVKALINIINNTDKASDVIQAVKELNAMHGFNEPIKHQYTGEDKAVFNVVFVA